MQRLKIPWLIDIVRVSSARDVQLLSDHPCLDRNLERVGPLINRWMLGIILTTLRVAGRPLPAFRGRWDEDRRHAQEALRRKLDAMVEKPGFDLEQLEPAVAFVAGKGELDRAMAAICLVLARVFDGKVPDEAGDELWSDARILAASVQPFSLTGWRHRLAGRHAIARARLLDRVDHEPNGLHALAITTANISVTLAKMKERYRLVASGAAPSPVSSEQLWLHVRTAPSVLFRRVRATMSLPTCGHVVTPEALLLLQAREAQGSEPPLGFAFLQNGWSACPAADYVQALCWNIWCAADGEAASGGAVG